MIVGTAGHIDHGKTALVRALTGIDTDRLKEEKARGITIELGFAHWPRPGGGVISFIDVPGHERLVHTMLAGATGLDFVILAVAGDDGVMPQTREHLAIIDLLGLRHGLVVITKCDLVGPERRAAVAAEIEALLPGTGLEGADILAVSAQSGEGMAALIARLDRALAETAQRSDAGSFRLGIDRVFTLTGGGTIATGTVISGRVAVGDPVVVSPSGLEARVRSLHVANRPAEQGRAGERCAVALAGARIERESVTHGEMLVAPWLHAPTRRVDASLSVLASERRPVGQWMPVRFHHAAAEVPARVVVLRERELAPGERDFIQLVLEAPIAAAAGDRFVLRDTAATRTIGGGMLLDLRAPERRRRTAQRRAELEALSLAEPVAALAALLACEGGWVDLRAFLRDRAAAPDRMAAAVAELSLVVFPAGETVAALLPATWTRFAQALVELLEAHHREQPEQPGLGQERLRLALKPRLPAPVFALALKRLRAEGEIVLDRSWVRRPGHEVRLSPQEEDLWAEIRPLLAGAQRFRPPRVRDISKRLGVDEPLIRRLFKLAGRLGQVDELAHDHFFLAETVVEMAEIARTLAAASADGAFSVTDFRDRLANGRKVAIQILEFFDRQGLTMRRGDIRRINPHKADLYARDNGGASSPVGRPDFKSGEGRETVLGGFDSYLLRQPSMEA